jgi:hypothetical protein
LSVATVTSNDARRPKRVRPVIIEDGEFEVAVEWCAGDRLPHACLIAIMRRDRVDVDQLPGRASR